jgi:integrase
LYIRVRSIVQGGAVSFRYHYLFDGVQRRITLDAKTLADARTERNECKALLKKGKDPSLERILRIERQRAAQLEEQEALAKLNARTTVNGLFSRWHDIDLIDRKDRAEIVRMFHKDVLPDLGHLFVEDVGKAHISFVIDKLKLRGVKHLARNILKLMRQMFLYAVDQGVVALDPTASLGITKSTTKPTERDRVLSEVEIRALARQIPNAGLLKTTECAIWISLSTMCRIGELSKARFSDLDMVLKTWIIPASHSKNGKAHTIYLSEFALEQFKTLKDIGQSETWIFPNRDNTSHVCAKSITVQIGGRQTENILSKRSKSNQALVLAGGKWTPHDLRRTGATMMGNLRIASDTIEKCLNHTEENSLKRIYQRQLLEAEQAEAWRVLGERLNLLVNADASNVVPMYKRI